MVPYTSIIYESEVSITVLCLLFSPRYTAVRIKSSTSVIKVTAMQEYDGAACPSYRLKLKYPLPYSVSYV